jgi:guanine deaminase
MESFAIHGDLVYASAPDRAELLPAHYTVCEDGICAGVFRELPDRYAGLPVEEFGGMLVTPGYTDLHLHAPQHPNVGLGMDLELLDWLEQLTFPAEARFADPDYAEKAYTCFVRELRQGMTTRACVFATVHVPATIRLMELLEDSGLVTMVGKVNMDRNAPDTLRETSAQRSLWDTEAWLEQIAGRFRHTAPIITPRFVPSCTAALMEGLGAIAAVYGLPIQSHLSENLSEIQLVHELHPDCPDYGSVYEKYGLMESGTVMAHCIYLTEAEIELMRRRGVFLAHCPTSNSNVRSGIAPIRNYLERGLHVGLGSDVSGGHTLDMAAVIQEALRVSKLLWRLDPGAPRPLKAAEAFYLATRGGGAFFGRAGAFLPGFAFDAVVVDDARLQTVRSCTPEERFEKFVYLSGSQDVRAKYVDGVRLF